MLCKNNADGWLSFKMLKGCDIMKERINTIDGIPHILEEIPGLFSSLEKNNGWGKKQTPTDVLKNWDLEEESTKFYFLGWLRKSVENFGVFSLLSFQLKNFEASQKDSNKNLRYFGLREKIVITNYLNSILEEASIEELRSFEKGEKETFRRRKYK